MNLTTFRAVGAVSAMMMLSGCGDLTRSEVERILSKESRGSACNSTLNFIENGFERAKASGVMAQIKSGGVIEIEQVYKIADLPGGDIWQAKAAMFEKPVVSRMKQRNSCLPGSVEITAIADPPFGPGNGGYKQVEFVEIVQIPPELEKMRPFVFVRYKKTVMFQKTDRGWRVAP